MTGVGDPPYDWPAYRSTTLRAPRQPLVVPPPGRTERTGPVFGADLVRPGEEDLTRQHPGEPIGQRIVVHGRLTDIDSRALPGALVEIWQANAAGRYAHRADRWRAPLDPNFSGAGRLLTDDSGRYRFTTIRPGAYPWHNHDNAWRPAHIHFSLFGRAFTQRLVTQMYFPDDPLVPLDPIASAVRDDAARARMIAAYDHDSTMPEWALAYRFDIVLGATPVERP